VPELPEAEFGRKLAARVCEGRRIDRVRCADDDIVLMGGPAQFRKQLRGRVVQVARRRGKYIWFELDRGPHPIFHFGMTGAFRVPGGRPLKLESSPKHDQARWPPRFWKIHLTMEDSGELVMTNARRLGRIRLAATPLAEPPLSKLGFDPLLDLPRPAPFAELVRRRSVTLKGLLLNQAFAAGVGNWIADEVLYQARLDPRRRANALTDVEIRRMRAKLKHVIERAVAVDAHKDKFPRTWLFHHRWGRDAEATIGGHPIQHIDLVGRTTAWVPAVQR
jgi:formamidopyrimidine-DNA glycosylase